MTLEDDLLALIRAGDARGCIARTHRLGETERAKASAAMWKVFEAAHTLVYRDEKKAAWLGIANDQTARIRAFDAAQVALLGTTNRVDGLRKFSWRSFPRQEFALAVLRDRKPKWLPEWAALLCELAPHEWTTVRVLVKDGILPRPTTDHYVLGMINAARQAKTRWNIDEPRGKELAPLFERDPDLLKEDIWRIFEVEGHRGINLTGGETFWTELLLALIAKKKLGRARAIDATLAALARDFGQHKAGFFSRFHDALALTDEELAARTPRYVALLTSRIPPTVSCAVHALEAIAKADKLDAKAFVAAAPTARGVKARGVATTLVSLLGRIGGESAALAATQFLENEAPDVTAAVLAVLEASKKTSGLVAAVRPFAPTVPASQKKRLEAWLGASPAAKTAAPAKKRAAPKNLPKEHVARAGAKELAAAPAVGPWPRVTLDDPAPRLDPAHAIAPIADHEELFEAVARALEAPEDRVNVERMLDGVSRLGTDLPAARVKPALKRAQTRMQRFSSDELPSFIAAWLSGAGAIAPEPTRKRELSFTHVRLDNILGRVAKGQLQPLLCFPANERFVVDPAAIAPRLKAQKIFDREDAIVALLRLAPDGRAAALATAKSLQGPLAAPLRHALGAKPAKIAGDAALWIAAARARAPGRDDPTLKKALPKAGPNAGEAMRVRFVWSRKASKYSPSGVRVEYDAHIEPAAPKAVPREHVSVALATRGDASIGDESTVRDTFSLMPLDRRALFTWGTLRLRSNVDWSNTEWENHVALEPLIDPDTPLDDVALTLLAIGTNTREPRENALATDALIAAIVDGRVVGPELAAAMASLWHPLQEGVKWVRRPTGNRWAKTLTTAARASSLHAEVLRRTLEALFATPPSSVPPDVSALLELWLELCEQAETGVAAKEARAWLAKTPIAGKTKALAKKLLGLAVKPSSLAAEAHAEAIAGRWARAERYAAMR